ncbi:MAG: hydrogenase maturation nickel metallochaperone HypA [Cyanobacteria bacterium J083]|nr:MAG: hydrogenase maturation nickel metallochaperone HypA [Cyanobacteria bacterium J083]
MHEVSLMQNALNMAIEQAKQNKAQKISHLCLNIGQLSGVIPEALEFAFEILVQGTIAENAQLEIRTIPVVCYCQKCDRQFQANDFIYECPQCQQISSNIVSGRELELASLIID